jgi:hypothetical protein
VLLPRVFTLRDLQISTAPSGLQPKKRIVGASERDAWLRAAWRVIVAEQIEARRLEFVDEMER